MVARGFQSTYNTMHIQSWLINALFAVIQTDTLLMMLENRVGICLHGIEL